MIDRIDVQAQNLLQLLDESSNTLESYLDPDRMGTVTRARAAVIELRRALLGAQMGPLYWERRESDAGPTPPPEAGVPPLREG
ncbi:MAG: hypothetical protein ABIQ99_14965 [Thermoflexales bacterium]